MMKSIYRTFCFTAITLPLLLTAANARELHVTPQGQGDADGTLQRPFDLVSVLTKPGLVQPGDTVWIHEGIYKVGLIQQNPEVRGSKDKPIVFRAAPDQRAVIEGGLTIRGHYTWLWGLEITAAPADGVNVRGGDGIKLINLIVHDIPAAAPAQGPKRPVGQGVGAWNVGNDHEYYGNILYRNGSNTLDHGIYTQNDKSHTTKKYLDNIIFQNAGCGLHLYGQNIQLANLHVEGNICFATGLNPRFPAKQPQMNMIMGGYQFISDLVVKNNCTYHPSLDCKRGVDVGYTAKGNKDILIQDNYFMCGANAMEVKNISQNVTVRNNTFWAPQGMVAATFDQDADKSSILWDNNTYIHNGIFDLAQWQQATGFDKNSKMVTGNHGKPTGLFVFKRVNKYEPRRIHLAVYNWDHKDTVQIDVSDLLKQGSNYRIVNVLDLFAKPVAEGKVAGTTINLAMHGHDYEPEFGAYLLFRELSE